MQFTDEVIKKFELIKSEAQTGVSFRYNAQIYETSVFDGLRVYIMDCDMEGYTENVRDKNLLTIVVFGDEKRYNFLISAQMLKHFEIEVITQLIKNNIHIHDNNRKETG